MRLETKPVVSALHSLHTIRETSETTLSPNTSQTHSPIHVWSVVWCSPPTKHISIIRLETINSIEIKRLKPLSFVGCLTKLEDFDQYISVTESGRKCCGLCFVFVSESKRDLRVHIESKHFPNTFSYTCEECG